jgi:FKBP-type peptidyl-prolyl cis-trans isomerase FkpA
MEAAMPHTARALFTIRIPLLALAAGLFACGGGSEAPPTQNPDAAYAIGLLAERSIEQLQLTPDERAEFERGMRDYRNRTPRVVLLGEISRIQSFQMERTNAAVERERAEAETFLRAAASEPDAEQLPSGIVLRQLTKGEGATPTTSERAIVRAEGTLPDGLLFFSSKLQNQPLSVDMTTGIPCLTEPLARMKVGSRAQITCPPQTGYAFQNKPMLVPTGAGLRFEVELLEVKPNLPSQAHP